VAASAHVLVAKVGLDAIDRGSSAIVRVLRDDGHEVVFSGAGLTPAMVAEACLAERVDVLVLSMPSQAMPLLVPMVMRELARHGLDVPVVLAGPVFEPDLPALRTMGVAGTLGAAPSAQQIRDVINEAAATSTAA
jgi:methylmalonyl-CoA mutase C-terminal domain/subunit